MAGKKKKEKKKKGKKGGDGGHIAAALMPTASILAVPRSPPLARTGDMEHYTASSGILNSTLLGRMYLKAQDPDQTGAFSETDTSLYDYDNARKAYATLEMRAGPSGESLAVSRAQGHSPYHADDTGDEISIDEFVDEPDIPVVRENLSRSSPAQLYSTVDKSKKKKSSQRDQGPPRSSMKRYQEEDERVTGRSPSRSPTRVGGSLSRGPSPVRNKTPSPARTPVRTPSPSILERISESTSKVNSSLKCYRYSQSIEGESATQLYDVSASNLKMTQLERQQTEMLERVQQQTEQLKEQQHQLQQQYQLQQQLMEKLLQHPEPQHSLQEMGTLLQSTQSVTDATLQHQDQLMYSLQEHAEILMREKEELQYMNEELQAEIDTLRRVHPMDTAGSGDDVTIYRKQIQDLREERSVLKDDIQRLNSELGRYIKRCQAYKDKYGSMYDQGDMIHMPPQGIAPSWQVNWKFLSPLFLAYDERIAEKDAIIQQFEDDMEEFRTQLEEVVKENERLHLRIEQSDGTGPISMTEWRQLQEQCKLVLEENQLLMEQLDIQQNKAKEVHKHHIQEVTSLSKKVVILESEKTELEQYTEELRQTSQEVKKLYDSMLTSSQSKVAVDEHITLIQQLKRSQDDQKQRMEQELSSMRLRLTTLNGEKKSQALTIEDLKAENKHLESELKHIYKLYRKSQRKEALLRRLLAEVESKEYSATKYLSDIVKLAEKTAEERDKLARKAKEQEEEKKTTLRKLLEESAEKNKLTDKMKLQKVKLGDKLHKAIERMKAQDQDFLSQRAEYEKEMKHLRSLLRKREGLLELLTGEKRQIEDDLETLWQLAASDNKQMRENLQMLDKHFKVHKSEARDGKEKQDPNKADKRLDDNTKVNSDNGA